MGVADIGKELTVGACIGSNNGDGDGSLEGIDIAVFSDTSYIAG